MSNKFLAIVIAIIIGVGAIFWFTRDKASAPTSGGNNSTQTTNHIMGNGKKNVTLIEYGDYQCPACGAYYPVVKAVVDKYKDDIYFQFRNFPLVSLHQNAFAGARAAEAADKQGKFWQMHDLLYEQQNTWGQASSPKTYFDSYAQQLGLDVTKFDQDYASGEVNDLINADKKAAEALGATGTPTFVLDGKKLDNNPQDQAAFEKLITDAIAAKSSSNQ